MPKSASLEAALEAFELYANLSSSPFLKLTPPPHPTFLSSLGACTAPHNPNLACRVKLSFHSGKKLMKILHTEVLKA